MTDVEHNYIEICPRIFLAPLAKGQRAIVMALCLSCVPPSIRPCVRKLCLQKLLRNY